MSNRTPKIYCAHLETLLKIFIFFFNICNFLKNQSAEILEDKDIGNEKAIAGKTKNVGKSGKTDTNAKVSRD